MNRRKGITAGAVFLALALTACSGTAPPDPALSGSSTGGSPAGTPGPDASADPAGGRAAGGFGSLPEACAAVTGTTVALLALPKAAATGKDSAEAEQARTELEGIRTRVPEDLKGHFEMLKSVADNAGQDYSAFDRDAFDSALVPVAGWLEAHC